MSVPAAVAPPQVPSTQVSASSLPPSASASQLAAPRATAGFLRPRHIEDLRTQVAKSDYGRLRRQAQLFGKVLPHAFLEKMPDVALQLSDLVIFAWNQGKTEKKQRQEKEREALQKAQMKEGAPPQLAEKPEKAEKGSAPATLANTSSSSSSAPASTGDPKDDDAINSDTVNKMILQFQRYQVYIKTSSGSSEEFTLKCSDGEVKCNLGLITFWCDLSPDANALEKLKRKLPRSRKTLEAFKQYLYTGYFPSSFDLNVLDSMRLLIELMQFLQEFQRPALVAEIETQLSDAIKNFGSKDFSSMNDADLITFIKIVSEAAAVSPKLEAALKGDGSLGVALQEAQAKKVQNKGVQGLYSSVLRFIGLGRLLAPATSSAAETAMTYFAQLQDKEMGEKLKQFVARDPNGLAEKVRKMHEYYEVGEGRDKELYAQYGSFKGWMLLGHLMAKMDSMKPGYLGQVNTDAIISQFDPQDPDRLPFFCQYSGLGCGGGNEYAIPEKILKELVVTYDTLRSAEKQGTLSSKVVAEMRSRCINNLQSDQIIRKCCKLIAGANNDNQAFAIQLMKDLHDRKVEWPYTTGEAYWLEGVHQLKVHYNERIGQVFERANEKLPERWQKIAP